MRAVFRRRVTRDEDGALTFMPDELLGSEPRARSRGLSRNLGRMFDEDFNALLFAHAEPMLDDGRAILNDFLARNRWSRPAERGAFRSPHDLGFTFPMPAGSSYF